MVSTALFTSDTECWNTPPHIIEFAYRVMGTIELDPCSDAGYNVPANRHFTEVEDGLAQDWRSPALFMNPPYGRVIRTWMSKAVLEYLLGHTTQAILLIPARTDTHWWKIVRNYPVCFIQGRLKFGGAVNSAPFPSALIYLGDAETQKFTNEGNKIGRVYVPTITDVGSIRR